MKQQFTKTRSPLRLASERALTLIEIVVVLAILGILVAFLATRVFGAGDKARADITKVKLKDIKSKIEEFQLRYNALPNSLDALTTCNDQTGQGCVPIVPSSNTDVFRDAWGTPFRYNLDGARAYVITSLGADAKEGGDGINYDFNERGP